VLEAMLPFFDPVFGNPSSAYHYGFELRSAVENGRAEVAKLIGAEADEIVFTSCNNLR
jgi:cysteine desulfurase